MIWRKIHEHLPLAVIGGAFLISATVIRCAGSSDMPPAPQSDAGSAGETAGGDCRIDANCALPPSYCGSSDELVYFFQPKCVANQCAWSREIRPCACSGGGCLTTTTAGGGGPISPGSGMAGTDVMDASEDASHPEVAAPEGVLCSDASSSGTAGNCELPPSICADARWLAIFSRPSCGSTGTCTWTRTYRDCGGDGCRQGSCGLNVRE